MVEQLAGVASVAVVVLAYLMLLEAMTAAMVLLATFTVVQWRSLRALLVAEPSHPVAAPAREVNQARGEPYRVGGGLAHWD
jgi:hypothetical protein